MIRFGLVLIGLLLLGLLSWRWEPKSVKEVAFDFAESFELAHNHGVYTPEFDFGELETVVYQQTGWGPNEVGPEGTFVSSRGRVSELEFSWPRSC